VNSKNDETLGLELEWEEMEAERQRQERNKGATRGEEVHLVF